MTAPPGKEVGEQLTLSVPANSAEFRRHVGLGLRRQGYLTPRPDETPQASRKGCQKLSRAYVHQDKRSAIHEYAPADIAPAELNFLTGRWEENHEAQRDVGLAGWTPSQDIAIAAPNRDTPTIVDRRGEWSPSSPAQQRPLRAAMYKLRDGMRPISQPRVQACGRACISPNGHVGVMATSDGRVKLTGLAHCGSVWECATCQMQIQQSRAEQLRQAVDRHGSTKVAMLTLTIRHGAGDNLRAMRRLLTRAWAGLNRHRAFKRWSTKHGLIGKVRAIEVTHGQRNGWHPHLHVLFFFDEDVPTATMRAGDGFKKVWDCPEFTGLTDLWIRQVVRIFGEQHRPSRRRALAASLASDGEYISKLGLELSDPGTKAGHKIGADGDMHRTPFGIAADWVEARNAYRDADDKEIARTLHRRKMTSIDARLWRTYCEDMRGAHRLVWSNGLKKRLGVADISDAEIVAEDEEKGPGDTWIASIPVATWQRIRDERIGGVPVPLYLIHAAESGGSKGFDDALIRVATGEAGNV